LCFSLIFLLQKPRSRLLPECVAITSPTALNLVSRITSANAKAQKTNAFFRCGTTTRYRSRFINAVQLDYVQVYQVNLHKIEVNLISNRVYYYTVPVLYGSGSIPYQVLVPRAVYGTSSFYRYSLAKNWYTSYEIQVRVPSKEAQNKHDKISNGIAPENIFQFHGFI
jgi:hypothetical protein